MNFPKIALILLTVFSLTAISRAQQEARHPGIILYEQGKYKEAAESLKNAVSKDPNKSNATLWSYLGLSQTEKGEGKNAVKSLEKATALEPSNPSFRVNLSYAYLRNRQVNRSQAEAKKVIELDPKRLTAYYLLGIGYLAERKFGEAEQEAEGAVQRADPRVQDHVRDTHGDDRHHDQQLDQRKTTMFRTDQ